MAHLRSKIDLMHVPTPLPVVESIRAFLRIPQGCVALDPCCGTGEALAALAPGAEKYGIEIELDRARAARDRLDRVLIGSMQECRLTNDSAGLVFLNPPYDDSTEGRLEQVFVERCTKYVHRGGILVLIVKQDQLAALSGFLRRRYEIVGHWRFPDPFWDGPELAFGQTVLVLRRFVIPPLELPSKDDFLDHLTSDRPALPEKADVRVDVPIGQPFRLFLPGELMVDDLAELVATSPLTRTMRTTSAIGCGRPPLPLKQGHIALTLASGVINGPYGEGPTHHLAKGTVVRVQTTKVETETLPSGDPCMAEKLTDSFAIRVRALRPNGTIHDLTGGAMDNENGGAAA